MKKIFFLGSISFFVILTVALTSFTKLPEPNKKYFHHPVRSTGISGVSTTGCGGGICHGGSANSGVTLAITGLPVNPIVGTTYTLAFVVSGPNTNAGFNLAVNSGTLNPISGDMSIQLMGGELTHSFRKPFSGGVATFDFTWTPTATGPVVFTYAGNNVNGNGSNSGDVWNIGSINTSADVLPVKITSFQGSSINKSTNKLVWQTEQEINFKQYEVEKSCDGLNFDVIGTVLPSANSGILKNYQFTDVSVNCTTEKTYYRLKIVNANGSVDYSSIVAIVGNNKEVKPFLYPNPAIRSEGFVKVNTGSQKAKNIKLFTTNGVELKSYNNINAIESTLELPKNIVTGSYYLSIYYENDVRKTISFMVK
jgi:hypothetical protein